jgi:hypothetical protein
MMKLPMLVIAVLLIGCSKSVPSKEQFLGKTMIPLAREFIQRNGLPYNSSFDTNCIKKYSVDFHAEKPGFTSHMTLTNGYFFMFWDDGTNSEIYYFSAGIRTSFNLARASKAEIQAVKALSLRNKLNDESALELAKHFFKLQGHKEADFHPAEFGPYTWGQKGDPDYIQYPFYIAQWYRKDANVKDRDKGILLPNITVTVSGISSNIVEYAKSFMPIGRDF